jgi:PAS domain S-box-containing protein
VSRTKNLTLVPPEGGRDSSAGTPRMEGQVLVVDDTEANRYVIVKALRRAGMQVWEASTGEEALAAAALRPDVVVLDVRLPDMSGFEVCRRLKEDPATAPIPILYISALLRDEELEARLFDDGADGYISQPIEPRHVVAQTWALVRMRRGELARQRACEEAQAERERFQRELDKQRARARRLTESGLVGILYWDAAGALLDANDTVLRMLGHTREELEAGRLDWRRMLPPERVEQDRQRVQELLARGVGPLGERHVRGRAPPGGDDGGGRHRAPGGRAPTRAAHGRAGVQGAPARRRAPADAPGGPHRRGLLGAHVAVQ